MKNLKIIACSLATLSVAASTFAEQAYAQSTSTISGNLKFVINGSFAGNKFPNGTSTISCSASAVAVPNSSSTGTIGSQLVRSWLQTGAKSASAMASHNYGGFMSSTPESSVTGTPPVIFNTNNPVAGNITTFKCTLFVPYTITNVSQNPNILVRYNVSVNRGISFALKPDGSFVSFPPETTSGTNLTQFYTLSAGAVTGTKTVNVIY